jgi:hypothetical protein
METMMCNSWPQSWNRNRSRLRFVAAFAGMLLAGLDPLALHGASFTASLDRNPIRLGENATLSLKFDGGTPETDPELPAIQNLQIAYIGPSSQFSVINGQVSSAVTYNYNIVPRQIGEFTLPAITVVVGGQKFGTQPLKLSVLKPGTPPSQAAGSDSEPAFLKLALPKRELYTGETIIAELQLYLSDKVQNVGGFQLTAMPAAGFNVGKTRQGQRRTVQVGNTAYTEIPFEMVLTPVKTGPLSIGPVVASIVVELPSPRRQRDPLWESLGFPGAGEQRTLSLATDTENVQVLPLPAEGAPADFNGAIGNYTMTLTAGPTNVAVGDPITVKVQIAGSGALDSLALPDQPAWRNFKTYPSAPRTESSDALGVRGAKVFEDVIVPQSTDIRELPPVLFSFFDTDSKSYRTLKGPAIPLTVRPGGTAVVPVIAAAGRGSQGNPPSAQDVVPIKQRLGEVAAITRPLVRQPWFLAAQGVPALALAGTVLWRKNKNRLAANPRLRRRRKVARLIQEGRNELRRAAAENNSDEFFAALFRLLQEQLGERLDLPASAITEAVIEERLRPGGVREETLAALHELLHACNLARYAPVKSSQELAAFIPKIETVLRELQEAEI